MGQAPTKTREEVVAEVWEGGLEEVCRRGAARKKQQAEAEEEEEEEIKEEEQEAGGHNKHMARFLLVPAEIEVQGAEVVAVMMIQVAKKTIASALFSLRLYVPTRLTICQQTRSSLPSSHAKT